MFGTAHNNSINNCELFFFCQTTISKTVSPMKLFFFSHKGMGWERAEKSSLAQLHPTQVGPNLGSWQICPVKH
jgi:hypothetical protein